MEIAIHEIVQIVLVISDTIMVQMEITVHKTVN
jgi:hypothetical protein